jgi:hypothetical protein
MGYALPEVLWLSSMLMRADYLNALLLLAPVCAVFVAASFCALMLQVRCLPANAMLAWQCK